MEMKRLSIAVLLLAVALAPLASCRGKDGGGGVATAGGRAGNGTADAGPQERARQFVACMRAEGIDIPDPEVADGTDPEKLAILAVSGPDGSVDKKKLVPAMEKCRRFLPNGGAPGRLSPEDLEKARQFAACMRENGVPTFPDPDPEGGRFTEGFEVDKDDTRLRAALERCRR